ncbi:PaaI family thioesterase [Rubrobacter indicoceani]|uniref:PaaI family thioesterase n=1 Tax=Rubrobacter indicoceani TaxID=2051957 RepID=UPI000E5B2CD0|nr:PaaI family thioesterase [Rubrobacter indicoceani]
MTLERSGGYEAQDAGYREKVKGGFEKQTFMKTIGATLEAVRPGYCEVHLPFRKDLCQHTGFIHAGVTTTISDNACGFAALTLMPPDSEVLSVEFKMNLLRPAIGEKLVARATVVKPGKTVTVVQAEVAAVSGGGEKPCGFMVATMMRLEVPEGSSGPENAAAELKEPAG